MITAYLWPQDRDNGGLWTFLTVQHNTMLGSHDHRNRHSWSSLIWVCPKSYNECWA